MPIFLDRHDPPDEITAEHVAEMHQKDLKVQHEFGCRGFTYWFDDKRKTGFCLIEAPDKEALIKMHDHAHGAIPHQIIEVEENMVEAFLGRLEDPVKAKDQKLNIIDEPAFRILMVVKIDRSSGISDHTNTINQVSDIIKQSIADYSGSIVVFKTGYLLISFVSVSKAVGCALDLSQKVNKQVNELDSFHLNIGINSGVPVTDRDGIFEETITLADRMCNHIKGSIVLSSDVSDLYAIENPQKKIDTKQIEVLLPSEQKFLNTLMDFIDDSYNKNDLMVDDFASQLGLSKSQVYRKLKVLSGKSPNTFIKDYRLKKALLLLEKGEYSVSEIAFEVGFNSPSYFSKCFNERFGISPSYYS